MAETGLEWFIECFEDRIAFVKQNCMDRVEGLMLLTAHLDALAGYCYPCQKSSLERFKDLLLNYSGDTETWSKVSLYTLYVELICQDKDVLKKLGEELFTLFNIHEYGGGVDSDCSPESLRHLLVSAPRSYLKVAQRCDYATILWSLRNEAVHESLDRNKPFINPLGQDIEPSKPYYSCDNVKSPSEWRFVQVKKFIIPNSFILLTLENCLNNFCDACRSGRFDFDAMRRSRRKAH